MYNHTGAKVRHFPRTADFAWFSNEDLGFVATLVTNTNDVYEFSLPYVASIDLFEETMILHANETLYVNEKTTSRSLDTGDIAIVMDVEYSMLDKAHALTYQGAAADTEDEALKSKLGGPNMFGMYNTNMECAANVGTAQVNLDNVMQDYWTPPQDLRLRTPLFCAIVNQSAAYTELTGQTDAASMANFENVAMRSWWSPSRLKRSERRAIRDVIKYQLIDT